MENNLNFLNLLSVDIFRRGDSQSVSQDRQHKQLRQLQFQPSLSTAAARCLLTVVFVFCFNDLEEAGERWGWRGWRRYQGGGM